MRYLLKAEVEGHGQKMFTTLASDSESAEDIIKQFIKAKYDSNSEIIENKPQGNGKG